MLKLTGKHRFGVI